MKAHGVKDRTCGRRRQDPTLGLGSVTPPTNIPPLINIDSSSSSADGATSATTVKESVKSHACLTYLVYFQRLPLHPFTMAIRAIESRFEQMSVTDENEPVNGGGIFHKSKVKLRIFSSRLCLSNYRGLSRRQCQYLVSYPPPN